MSMKEQIREHILKEHLQGEDPDEFQNDDDLIDSGILDSLATLKLVAYLEDGFGIKIGADEITPNNLRSVEALAAFVGGKLAARN